jgi:hypothetical protein
LCLSRHISKELISHLKKFKLLHENGFKKKPEEFYSDGFEKLVHCWWCCNEQEGVYVKT